MGASQERIFALLADLLRIIFVLIAVRSIMLLGNVPIISIPVIDNALFMLWNEVGHLANGIAGSQVLPRFYISSQLQLSRFD